MATKKANYGYTIADDADSTLADQSGGKFDTEKLRQGQAQLVETPKPDRKSMRYLGTDENPNLDASNAGAGRGKKGGSTAKDMDQASMSAAEKEMVQEAADNRDRKKADKAPTTKTEMGKRFKSGGVTRADGCITKGHTKGRVV
jgi:hypothetical protein